MRKLETVDRALQLLIAFDDVEDKQLTVGALASRLEIHRSSVSRLAATLAHRGFLERAPDSEAFRLGPTLGRLGLLAIGGRDVLSESQAVMERLAKETGETVVLSILENGDGVDVAQATGSHLVGTRNWIGRRSPLHATSDGKIFLAFANAKVGPRRLAALTERTITGRKQLAEEVQRVRERGWASVESEFEEGMNGVAVPIFDGGDRCVAAISVSGPAYRLPAERLPEVATSIQSATAEIAARLGKSRGQPGADRTSQASARGEPRCSD